LIENMFSGVDYGLATPNRRARGWNNKRNERTLYRSSLWDKTLIAFHMARALVEVERPLNEDHELVLRCVDTLDEPESMQGGFRLRHDC
jgi:hypothetical protein